MDAHGNRKDYEGMEVCGGELLEFIRKNRSLSREFCTKLYQELFTPIQLKIEHETEAYSFKQLEADFRKLNEDYLKGAIGPEKWNVLSDMDKKTVEAQKNNFKKVKGYQEKVMKERQRTKEAEIEARQRNEELKKLHQEAMREKEKNAENLKNMQANFQNQMEKVITKKLEIYLGRQSTVESGRRNGTGLSWPVELEAYSFPFSVPFPRAERQNIKAQRIESFLFLVKRGRGET